MTKVKPISTRNKSGHKAKIHSSVGNKNNFNARSQWKKKHKQPVSQPLTKEKRQVVVFNKPFDTLCQFTDDQNRKTLADFIPVKEVYAAGRLDKDSEGLLVLTNDGYLQSKITHPDFKQPKTYWVQVEGLPSDDDLNALRQGVNLKDGMTLPAQIKIISEPVIWQRTPPVRFRANIPTTWLEIIIREGRNRQVRRMTAHIGFPTLRLIRAAIGPWHLNDLASGEYRIDNTDIDFLL